ncbi:MAG TPA: BON domain-containing protein [Candidatus Binatia bacterium]
MATLCTAATIALAIGAFGCDTNRGDGSVVEGDARTSDAARDRTSELNPPMGAGEAGRQADRSAGAPGVNAGAPGAPGAPGAMGAGGGDATIVAEVRNKLRRAVDMEANTIDVRANDGVVTLTGRVSSEDVKDDAEELASDVEGVERVENQITVAQGPGAGSGNP